MKAGSGNCKKCGRSAGREENVPELVKMEAQEAERSGMLVVKADNVSFNYSR